MELVGMYDRNARSANVVGEHDPGKFPEALFRGLGCG